MSALHSLEHLGQALGQGGLDSIFSRLYPGRTTDSSRDRVRRLLTLMADSFPDSPKRQGLLLRTPGRAELGGNHTDHNNGHVLAAAVQLDMLAMATPRDDGRVAIVSHGFEHPIRVDLSDSSPREEEYGTPESIIRGVLSLMAAQGLATGGFDACVHSEVPVGSGLSSSAAFEIMVADIANQLYNQGRCDRVLLARIAQQAENTFFGKPCGLMDQLACCVGGVLHIDFTNPGSPVLQPLAVSFEDSGYQLCVVNTGGSHADLTPEYAAIPQEMRSVAAFFGQENLSGVPLDRIMESLGDLARQVGDRPILRALHFHGENERVLAQAQALELGDVDGFLRLAAASGDSSWRLLQNITPASDPQHQPIALGLAVTQRFLSGRGCCRVQGGGFAGTFQSYVPLERMQEYTSAMDTLFGSGSVSPLSLSGGHTTVIPLEEDG